MAQLLKTLPNNATGRDFIIGDLHGSLDLLMERLEQVGFDTSNDRLLSVGDLIDRGPHSFDALALLEAPWFHAVLGNHEAMLLTYLELRGSNYHRARHFLDNGGEWVFDLDEQQMRKLHELAERLMQVPLALRVEDQALAYNVVHAECMGSGPGCLTDEELASGSFDALYTPLTWGRRVAGEGMRMTREQHLDVDGLRVSNAPWEPGLSLTYTGHTIQDKAAMLHRSHLFIDRGGYKRTGTHTLMMVEHRHLVERLRDTGVL